MANHPSVRHPLVLLLAAFLCLQLGGRSLAEDVSNETRFRIKRLPIEFLVDEAAPSLCNDCSETGSQWFCVKIRLLPEDGGDKYAVFAKRPGDRPQDGKTRYRVSLLPEEEGGSDGQPSADGGSFLMSVEDTAVGRELSPYARDPVAASFIQEQHASEDKICHRQGGIYVSFADVQLFVHERLTKSMGEIPVEPGEDEKAKDGLERHIEKWNREWARPARAGGRHNGCTTRKECSGYHVSYYKIPSGLQEKIDKRLRDNWDEFYHAHGAGMAGTTGAHFLAGNSGYRHPDVGGDKLELLFPDNADMQEFERAMADVVTQRADVREKFGDHPGIDFQHRLWRFGPDFPLRGGVWHRDTCPFGIGGGVPQESWQLTSVYVLYADNMDLSRSGTRLKDRFGKTHDMPCIPGTANIMRSGENDPFSPWHAGPVLKKVNVSRPAYRVMMQSKMLLTRAKKRYVAGAERWGALGIPELPLVPLGRQRQTLVEWFANLSQALAWGASECNALGSEAYPINAQRAWARTEELADFLGFQGGFLPHFAAPPVHVEEENEARKERGDDEPEPDDSAGQSFKLFPKGFSLETAFV